MMKDNSKASQREATRAALNTNRNLWKQLSYPAYVGLDIHKDTIAVAVARAGRDEPGYFMKVKKREDMEEWEG